MRMIVVALLFLSLNVFAADFTQLLQEIKSQSSVELAQEKKRKQAFFDLKEKRTSELYQAKRKLNTLTTQSEQLKTTIDMHEQNITKLEEELQRKMGDLGELFGVIRQISGELKADFEHSMITVHYPERINFLGELSESKGLPDIAKLEKMWLTMLEELDEGRKISEFNTPVVQEDGTSKDQEVIRMGTYGAISEGDFLRYSSSGNIFEKSPRQPAARYHASANNFEGKSDGFVKVMIDPTRGQLIDMLTQKPTLIERIQQGGVVGYIIIGLGIIGLLLAIFRYGYLSIIYRKIKKQAKNLDKPTAKNPLGRIALLYKKIEDKAQTQKEVILEEAILKELPPIEKYNGLIKLLAAVSPLLGLLGTVTGMIITFQAITLFGTSDPKLMAGGISTALVTTVLGLSVAIPLLFAYTFIAAKTKSIIDLIEHQSVGLIAKEY
ncbi:MAG: MotA/TolQ/ExbB proton channel family protein [Epsilonproteobacteria bacterium]|nr:MotA/TolQ/ExbB proton channel family protein [Campylobacterota bacterium]